MLTFEDDGTRLVLSLTHGKWHTFVWACLAGLAALAVYALVSRARRKRSSSSDSTSAYFNQGTVGAVLVAWVAMGLHYGDTTRLELNGATRTLTFDLQPMWGSSEHRDVGFDKIQLLRVEPARWDAMIYVDTTQGTVVPGLAHHDKATKAAVERFIAAFVSATGARVDVSAAVRRDWKLDG